MIYPENAEIHILEDEDASRAYLLQVWAEAMSIYRSGKYSMKFSKTIQHQLVEVQKDFIDTSDCKKGSIGSHPVENKGGDGASLVLGGTNIGTGGKAKAAGRGDTNGEDAKGYGAGGAGASLRDMDYVTPSESVSNPTRGGSGSNGVIELRWEE